MACYANFVYCISFAEARIVKLVQSTVFSIKTITSLRVQYGTLHTHRGLRAFIFIIVNVHNNLFKRLQGERNW